MNDIHPSPVAIVTFLHSKNVGTRGETDKNEEMVGGNKKGDASKGRDEDENSVVAE